MWTDLFRPLLFSAIVALAPLCAAAETTDDEEPPEEIRAPQAPQTVVPPRLEEAVFLPYPDDAPTGEGSVEVVVRLAIGEDGTYLGAEVAQSAGDPFDQLALEAVQHLVFTPAMVNGAPAQVTISLPIRFVLAPPPPPTPPSGTIGGRVREAGTRKLLPQLELTLTPAVDPEAEESGVLIGKPITATTDRAGGFRFLTVPEGDWTVTIRGPGITTATFPESMEAGLLRQVVYKVMPAETTARTVVRVRRSEKGTAERIVEGEWIRSSAGASGGFLRVLESEAPVSPTPVLPTGLFPGAPVIRGSEGADSLVLIDGIESPLLYHFGLLTTVVGEHTIDHLRLVPGGTGADQGDHIGAVIDVRLRPPRTDRFGGFIEFSPIDATVFVDSPIGKPLGFYASFRRSFVDLYLGKLLPEDMPAQVTAMPVYTDFTGMVDLHPGKGHRIAATIISSSDGMELMRDFNDTPSSLASISASFTHLHGFWESPTDGPAEGRLSVMYGGHQSRYAIYPDLFLDIREKRFDVNGSGGIQLSDKARLRFGFGLQQRELYYGENFFALPREDEPGLLNPYATSPSEDEISEQMYVGGGYITLPVEPNERWHVVPGVRLDRWSLAPAATVDPRITATWKTSDKVNLRGSLGLYHQLPSLEDLVQKGVGIELLPEASLQTTVGGDWRIIPAVQASVDVYLRNQWNLVVSDMDLYDELTQGTMPTDVDAGRDLSNSGVGRAGGAEFSLRWKPVPQVDCLVAYTLSRSERRDHDDETWRLFQYDRPHQLTFAGQVKLPHEWSFGLRFRLASGSLDTPVRDSVYLADLGGYMPRWGIPYSERLRPYHQLDWRVQKTFRPRSFLMIIFLDVENTYYAQRDDVVIYNRSFSQRLSFAMVPLLRLGLRAEF